MPHFELPITWKTKRGLFKHSKEYREYLQAEKQKRKALLAENRMKSLQNIILSKTAALMKLEEKIQKGEPEMRADNALIQLNINEETPISLPVPGCHDGQLIENNENNQCSVLMRDQMDLSQGPRISQTQSLKILNLKNAEPTPPQADLMQKFDIEEFRSLQNPLTLSITNEKTTVSIVDSTQKPHHPEVLEIEQSQKSSVNQTLQDTKFEPPQKSTTNEVQQKPPKPDAFLGQLLQKNLDDDEKYFLELSNYVQQLKQLYHL